jgi:hypothetical protein
MSAEQIRRSELHSTAAPESFWKITTSSGSPEPFDGGSPAGYCRPIVIVVGLTVVRGPEWDHDLLRIFPMKASALEDFEQIAARHGSKFVD